MGEQRQGAAGCRRVERHRRLASTNSAALGRARSGAPAPAWILADEQTEGRGRHGRHWVSPPGNLHATRLLVAAPPAARLTGLAFTAALALHDAVSALLEPERCRWLRLKWPNDLMVAGDKLAGILIEADRLADHIWVAVGFGVNVAAAPPGPATSLAALGCAASAGDLFAALDPALERWLAVWDEGRGFAGIRAAWIERGPDPGAPASVRAGAETLAGRFAGLAENGALILELEAGGVRTIAAGEVVGEGRGGGAAG